MSTKKSLSDIGGRIKKIRADKNLTQKQFAESLGVVQGYLSELEKGVKTASDTFLIALIYRYEINEGWLKTGTGEPYNFKRQPPAKPQEAVTDRFVEAGKRLRECRGERSLETASNESGVAARAIKMAEGGKTEADNRHLYWAASAGGTYANWILTGKGPFDVEEAERMLKNGKISPKEYVVFLDELKAAEDIKNAYSPKS